MNDLRSYSAEIHSYAIETAEWPPSTTVGVIPPVLISTGYLVNADWSVPNAIGGYYRWASNEFGIHAAIVIHEPTRPVEQIVKLDARLDDGNLQTGKFRAANGSYIYILQE